MIVVLIIGILLAIAVPNFVTARNASRARGCVANLKQIDSAKQQYIMDKKQVSAYSFTQSLTPGTAGELAPTYIRQMPLCPANGTYTVGAGNVNPSCSFSDTQYPHSMT